MNQPRIAFLGLLAGLAAVTTLTTHAGAQAASAGPKVGTINLREVYTKIQETVDAQHSLQGMQDSLDLKQKRDKEDLEAVQVKINSTTKPGTDAHESAMADFDKKSLDFQQDEQSMKVKMVRAQGKQLVQAFKEIQAVVKDLATAKGMDVVLVNSGNDVPDNAMDIANPETLGNLIFGRNVMYASDKADLTAEAIATLDKNYKSGVKPAAPAAAPGH